MSDNENQDKPLHGPNLILDVVNFGPIAEAKNIEFRPMTVFVGPSNTGKSYLAMLLHAMLEGIPEAAPHRWRWLFGNGDSEPDASEFLGEVVSNAVDYVDYLTDAAAGDAPRGNNGWEVANAAVCGVRDRMVGEIAKAMFRSVRRFYEVSEFEQLRTGYPLSGGKPAVSLYDETKRMTLDSVLHNSFADDSILNYNERLIAQMSAWVDVEDEILTSVDEIGMLNGIFYALVRRVDLGLSSYYFPAARTGILTSHKVMSDSLIEGAHRFFVDDEHRPSVPYHKVARDFLRRVNNVTDPANRVTRSSGECGREAARTLEESVLRGRIEVVGNEYGPPDFEYLPFAFRDVRVPMFLSSSAVTEIAPIVAFLRSYVCRGDLLIIEEPESHLHPEAQQKMAAALALMVRRGLRVLITTHSHYFVEQLGTLVNASYASPDERAKGMRLLGPDLDRDLYLTEDEVAVYDFSQMSDVTGGTLVRQLALDEDAWGFYPDSYTDALNAQHNRNVGMIGARGGF